MWRRLGILIATVLVGCAPAKSPEHFSSALPVVPVVALESAQAGPLSEGQHGKPMLVSLWATWCEACHEEFAELNRLHEVASKRDALVVGVAVGDQVGAVKTMVEREGLRFQQYVDPEFRFADALGVRRVPTTLVVSRTGEIVFVGGLLDAAALRAFRAQM